MLLALFLLFHLHFLARFLSPRKRENEKIAMHGHSSTDAREGIISEAIPLFLRIYTMEHSPVHILLYSCAPKYVPCPICGICCGYLPGLDCGRGDQIKHWSAGGGAVPFRIVYNVCVFAGNVEMEIRAGGSKGRRSIHFCFLVCPSVP